jgi:hypothetical protein
MKRNRILPIVISLVLITTGILMANSNWYGTFTGNCSGNWKGTLSPSQDPPFLGIWEETSNDPPEHGILRGNEIEELNNSYYLWGDILDDEGNDIGDWEGDFPIPDAQAIGSWSLDTGENGDFIGSQP